VDWRDNSARAGPGRVAVRVWARSDQLVNIVREVRRKAPMPQAAQAGRAALEGNALMRPGLKKQRTTHTKWSNQFETLAPQRLRRGRAHAATQSRSAPSLQKKKGHSVRKEERRSGGVYYEPNSGGIGPRPGAGRVKARERRRGWKNQFGRPRQPGIHRQTILRLRRFRRRIVCGQKRKSSPVGRCCPGKSFCIRFTHVPRRTRSLVIDRSPGHGCESREGTYFGGEASNKGGTRVDR